ncbi:IS66 family insertion sequence element accessory protein TnpA [Photobacterium sp. DNB23_23_1]
MGSDHRYFIKFNRFVQQRPSTFFAKRRLLECHSNNKQSGFVRAEVVEQTTHYQVAKPIASNMTPSVNDIELSIPQGTPAAYVAELIGSLSS